MATRPARSCTPMARTQYPVPGRAAAGPAGSRCRGGGGGRAAGGVHHRPPWCRGRHRRQSRPLAATRGAGPGSEERRERRGRGSEYWSRNGPCDNGWTAWQKQLWAAFHFSPPQPTRSCRSCATSPNMRQRCSRRAYSASPRLPATAISPRSGLMAACSCAGAREAEGVY